LETDSGKEMAKVMLRGIGWVTRTAKCWARMRHLDSDLARMRVRDLEIDLPMATEKDCSMVRVKVRGLQTEIVKENYSVRLRDFLMD
jgi:hypothetical protein